MKRNLIYMAFVLACIIVTSCSKEVTISGTANKAKSFGLYTFEKGYPELLQDIAVDSNTGSFAATLEIPYDGLYLIGPDERVLYPLYLYGGNSVELVYEKNLLSLGGNVANEQNRILFQWENSANDVRISSFLHNYLPGCSSPGYEKFFAQLESAENAQKTISAQIKEKDGAFYAWLQKKMEADLNFYVLNYLRFSGFSIPDSAQHPVFCKNMDPHKVFNNPELLDIPYAGKMLETYVWYVNKDREAVNGEQEYNVASLSNKELQQEYLVSAASAMKSYNEYEDMLHNVGENFFTEPYRLRLKKTEEKLSWSKPGMPAPEFEAMAPDSTWMKLSDFKGKVVVVDVWATWCEPCRRMMPLFHKLQQKMAKENIAFLSVCVGAWAESGQWLEMSREFGIEHNNFFVKGWNSQFVKDYRITGVPRYMIIDEEGNIVNLMAPNPSTSKLEELILKTLE